MQNELQVQVSRGRGMPDVFEEQEAAKEAGAVSLEKRDRRERFEPMSDSKPMCANAPLNL